jgi:hypothetical protein
MNASEYLQRKRNLEANCIVYPVMFALAPYELIGLFGPLLSLHIIRRLPHHTIPCALSMAIVGAIIARVSADHAHKNFINAHRKTMKHLPDWITLIGPVGRYPTDEPSKEAFAEEGYGILADFAESVNAAIEIRDLIRAKRSNYRKRSAKWIVADDVRTGLDRTVQALEREYFRRWCLLVDYLEIVTYSGDSQAFRESFLEKDPFSGVTLSVSATL